MELEALDFHLEDFLEQTTALFLESAHDKDILLKYDIADDVPLEIRGDPYRLRQILTNLIGNAVKFTERGSVQLLVRRDLNNHVGQPGIALCISVRDTGIGMSTKALSQLFKPFSQGDSSTTRKYGGTGLGLIISKDLAVLMGGNIEVSSTLDEGSEFRLKVCLQPALEPVSFPLESSNLAGNRVLIVDDNSTNNLILKEHTLEFGMKPELAENGARALELLEQSAEQKQLFDVAIIDMNILDMSGCNIRADARFNEMKLIILTPNAYEAEQASMRDSGFDQYLVKPLSKRALHKTLLDLFAVTPRSVPDMALQGLHILMAEDNLVNQEVGCAVLKTLGCSVVVANNGLEALELWRQGGMDLILMDCMMPIMDGYECTRLIRKEQASLGRKHMPIIALTANASEGDKECCLVTGMDDYLPKPFQMVKLQAMIKRLGIIHKKLPSLPVDDKRINSEPLAMLRKMGGATLVQKVLDIFFTNGPIQLESIKNGMLANDWETVRYATHSLKSAAANVGAIQLSDLARTLEHAARDGFPEIDLIAVTALEQAYHEVVNTLQQEMDIL
jgi:CheY-like chemotaxis protein